MVLNAPLAYPWISAGLPRHLNSESRSDFEAQVAQSSETVAKSARKIIVTTRSFDLNGANTHAYATPTHILLIDD